MKDKVIEVSQSVEHIEISESQSQAIREISNSIMQLSDAAEKLMN